MNNYGELEADIKRQTTSAAAVSVMDDFLETPHTLLKTRRQSSKGWAWPKVRELWQFRELVFFFAWRDIKVRYKQTVMGASWAIIQPFMTMVIFSLFFGRLADVPSDGLPYPIFSYAALVPWTFFANAITQASNSLVINSNMIKKVYFPRLALPIATVMAGVLDFFLAFIVLIGMMFFYRMVPTLNALWLPLFILLALVTSLGVSLWLATMNVQFRDVHFAIPFITQVWLFMTPIAYPSSLLSEPWRTLYGLNPMAGVVEGFRWALLGTDSLSGPMLILSTIVALTLFVTGAFYFRRMEQSFADVL
jgi:lipopolysaccharide transport system permease protein